MEVKFVLKSVLDYLNDIKSPVMIVHFDLQTGVIQLSNDREFHIDELDKASDIEKYL